MRRLRLRIRSRRTTWTPSPFPIPDATVALVCAMTAVTHEIADVEFTRVDSGRYLALCGAVVAASPMSVPEGRRCPTCGDARDRAAARRNRRASRSA